MNAQENLIDQLESAIAEKSMSRRAEVLRRVTDLFVMGSGKFSDAEVDLFADVMGRLTQDIELNVRATFGSRLASLRDAPRGIVHSLARDGAIEVAGPVLRNSPQLDEATLIEISRTMSQDHLLAISGRTLLTEPVTDVLIDRGDRAVVASVAENRGAKFSDGGISALVNKTGTDADIALAVWSRPDIPRQALLNVFVRASAAVRKRLEATDPKKAEQIRSAVRHATDVIQATARKGSHEYNEAQAEVRSLNAAGKLNEAVLLGFAAAGDFDRISVALSIMCNLPIELVERALAEQQHEQLLLFAKAVGLSWGTVKALLAVQAGNAALDSDQLDQLFKSFCKLQPKTAQIALQFYRLRERASTPVAR